MRRLRMSERRFTTIVVLILLFFYVSTRTPAANTTPGLEDWVELLSDCTPTKEATAGMVISIVTFSVV
jgi:hypothetical protein